jgi:PAS domain S-box-containing protein
VAVILLVHEDQPGAAGELTALLGQAGLVYDWVFAATKDEIQKRLSRDLDLALVCNDNSPQDTCRSLVSAIHENGRALPFIVISQITDPETVVACLKLGASDYLPATQLNRLPHAIQQALHNTTETALRQSEERFSKIFRSSPAPISITTLEDGHYLDANDEFLKLTGFSREELLKHTSVELGNWADPESRMHWIQELIKNRKSTRREEVFHLPSGQDIYIITSDELIETGGRECILTVFYNITELKQADITLRKNEQALELRLNQLSLINDVGRQISRVLEVDRLLATAAEQIHERFGYYNVAIFTLEPESSDLVLKANKGGLSYQLETNYRQKLGAGMVGWSGQHGKTLLANDVSQSTQYLLCDPNEAQTQAELCVPINIAGKVLGVLDVQSPALNAFDESDLMVMETLANQLAGALENARLVEEIRGELDERLHAKEQMNKQVHRLAALRDIDLAITASLDLRITLQIILDKISNQLNIDAVAILLLNQNSQMLEYAASQGFHKSIQKKLRLNLGDSLAGRTVREGSVIVIPDLSPTLTRFPRNPVGVGEGFVTYYGVPLITKGVVKGVLEIYQRSPLPSDPDWLGFLEALATQAALAIDDARLFEDLQRSNAELTLAYDTTLEGWSRALDMRDQETEGHSRRVTDLTMSLAQTMGIYGDELTHIYRGALLHDIGKMGIPDSILLKPGPLTPEEWVIMRTHPQNAYTLLAPISHLRRALDIPYSHHEKWDGSGYPRGLKGEEIPLSARIFAVVDTWDALNSDRPYRKAWSREKAFIYILQQTGKAYDPAVVEQFTQFL